VRRGSAKVFICALLIDDYLCCSYKRLLQWIADVASSYVYHNISFTQVMSNESCEPKLFFFPETEDTKVLIYHYILLVCMVEQTTNNFIESYIFFPITFFSLLWVRIFYRARKKKIWMRKLFSLFQPFFRYILCLIFKRTSTHRIDM